MLEYAGIDRYPSDQLELDCERRAAAVLEVAFDASFELDAGAIITGWSRRAEKLFGWSEHEAVGQHMQALAAPRSREELTANLQRGAIRERLDRPEPLRIRALHRDGRRFSIQLFLYPHPAQSRLTAFVRDLTDQEQLRNLLAERTDQRTILNFIEDGYTELDLQGNHQWVNDAFCRIFDRTREEVLDPDYQKITHRPVSVDIREVFKKVYQTGEPVMAFEYEAAPGLFCESTISLKRGASGQPTGFVALIRNTTERKRHELELAKAKDDADAANRAKSEFLANMSHEIRTPMNGIIGMNDLALSTDLSEEQREYLSMVRSSADDLLVIINDILDYSKIEAGKIDLTPVSFNLCELVGDGMKSLAISAHRKNLELAFRVDANVPETLVGDAVRLRQVLTNLAGNAVKFTETGEVVVNARLESREGTALMVHFSVRDTGIGIPAEAQARLFRPFEQADSSTTRQYGGTGLGLAISKKLVELLGGKIWMESLAGEGSTFHFTVRLDVGENSEPPALSSDTDLRGMPALIIDDNETNRRILQETLARWKMSPQAAGSGPEGLAKLEAASAAGRPFRLILLDEQMPGMGGIEIVERIQASSLLRGATIMMLTSADQSLSAARCRELGVPMYLIKPIKPAELHIMIQKSLTTPRCHTTSKPSVGGRSGGRSLSILVAEDNVVNQRVAAALLERMGHQVTIAPDGTEAISKWNQHRYDLILMDVQMPGIDGIEATRRIRNQELAGRPRTPIIAMTARAMPGDRELCVEAGMDDYVSKPVSRGAIERALASYIRQ